MSALRLAFRSEGDWWVCYCARPGTMDGAMEVGRVLKSMVLDGDAKAAFMRCMEAGLAFAIKASTGRAVTAWSTETAPESERVGHA